MNVFIYRLGVAIRELGERAGHRRRWWAGAAIRLGLAIREHAMNGMRPVGNKNNFFGLGRER